MSLFFQADSDVFQCRFIAEMVGQASDCLDAHPYLKAEAGLNNVVLGGRATDCPNKLCKCSV